MLAISGTQDADIATPDLFTWSFDPSNIYLEVAARSRPHSEPLGVRMGDPIGPTATIQEQVGMPQWLRHIP